MIAAALGAAIVAGAFPPGPALSWHGHAAVYDGAERIAIEVRTTIARDGTVTSESWPEALGEAKGLHRMVVRGEGGEALVQGKSRPLAEADWAEERAQFAIYRQLQIAIAAAPRAAEAGANVLSVAGPVRSWFRFDREGRITDAVNQLDSGNGAAPIAQHFRFDGWLESNGAHFPRRMMLERDGRPYFELEVDRFDGAQ